MPMSKRKTTNNSSPDLVNPPDRYWETKQNLEKERKKLFIQKIFADWCKACGICIAFCPANVFEKNDRGMPHIKNPDACNGCRFCEFHCPDFAISIQERYPDRRIKKNGA
jgi:2-oxoglutarate ferredoxin oxidoreductase subunit delta